MLNELSFKNTKIKISINSVKLQHIKGAEAKLILQNVT